MVVNRSIHYSQKMECWKLRINIRGASRTNKRENCYFLTTKFRLRLHKETLMKIATL